MSIRPMDINSIYLRMVEVSRAHDKEIKKEEREQNFQKQVQKIHEENFDRIVNQVHESQADQTVKEHEEHGMPVREKQKHKDAKDSQGQLSAEKLALPMLTLDENANPDLSNKAKKGTLDPDLGQYINIES